MEHREVAADLRARIEKDPWAQALGIRFLDVRTGYAKLSLQLQPHMLNFQGYPHGGVIFTLGDMAFGAACNSHGHSSVALTVTISYLAAARPDVTLIAECRQVKQGRHAGFYDVSVRTEDGRPVAAMHCVAHRVRD